MDESTDLMRAYREAEKLSDDFPGKKKIMRYLKDRVRVLFPSGGAGAPPVRSSPPQRVSQRSSFMTGGPTPYQQQRDWKSRV
jgi:hypothetical protein